MKRLIIQGDPGIRKGAVVEHEGEQLVCFGVTRNGEWHGPADVQLWCTVGDESEIEDFEKRNFIPHFLDVDLVDADEIDVLEAEGELIV